MSIPSLLRDAGDDIPVEMNALEQKYKYFSEDECGLQSFRDLPRWMRYMLFGYPKEIESVYMESRIPVMIHLWRIMTLYVVGVHVSRFVPYFFGTGASPWLKAVYLFSAVIGIFNLVCLVVFAGRVQDLLAKYRNLTPGYFATCYLVEFALVLLEQHAFKVFDLTIDVIVFVFIAGAINSRAFLFRQAYPLAAIMGGMYVVSLFYIPQDYLSFVLDFQKHFIWVGIIFCAIAFFQEYSERYAYVVQLRLKSEIRARRRAEDAARRQRSETLTTLAKMFHEIRTPLGCLLGLHDLYVATKCEIERSEYAKAIQSSGSHLMQLLNDILDYSKLRAGKVTLNESWNDPNSVLTDCARSFSSNLAKKGLELVVDMDKSFVGQMKFDKTRVHQICSNFLSNGIKFTPEAGQISLKVNFDIDVRRPDGRFLDVRVVDTGVGMSKESQERVFEEFYQVDSTLRRSVGGAGLGLSIASNLAKVMQGQVSVESKVNEGSTFRFRCFFPVVYGPYLKQEAPADPQSPAQFSDHPLKLLLVDDTPLNIRVFQAQLQRWGCSVITAHNGPRAIEIMDDEATEVDAIIMDVHMPEMDGLETSKIVTQRHPLVPVFGLTADLTVHENLDMFKASGMRHVLYKPLSQQHVQTISRILATLRDPDSLDMNIDVRSVGSDKMDQGEWAVHEVLPDLSLQTPPQQQLK